MNLASTLLEILADGHFHSGTELGRVTNKTRSAVWKAIQLLKSKNIEIYSVQGKGYRLNQSVELLNSERIFSGLNPSAKSNIQKLDVYFEVESTNAYLLNEARHGETNGHICLAEVQKSGRGRRGRTWISPFGGNLYLSLLWRFTIGATQLAGLSLAMAVTVARVLREIGLQEVGVKWPNDIIVSNQKLAGILLEITGEASGPCSAVIGIGLNVRNTAQMSEIDQPWTSLESVLGNFVPRNELAALLINHLTQAINEFEQDGFSVFIDEWRDLDVFQGKDVVLNLHSGAVQGIAKGVDDSGALLLAHGGEIRQYQSGEVSMRAVEA